jgi:Pyruvate/2-oxoacid:ferredoxin oxidoreductase gamma subunit
MLPVDASAWVLEEMTKVFPLGVYRDGHDDELGHPRRRSEPALEQIPQLIDIEHEDVDLALPDHDQAIEETRIKVAGFGGQGVILLGMLLAHAAMLSRRQVSWIPSYGPEMRGGTANCSVTMADTEIGTPLIENPTILVAMNGPSLDKFGSHVVPGGVIFVNTSLADKLPERDDVTVVPVPVNEIADRLGQPKVANMVMMGAMLAKGCSVSREAVAAALPKLIKAGPKILELDRKAIEAGIEAV